MNMVQEFYQNFSHFRSEKYFLESYKDKLKNERKEEMVILKSQINQRYQFEERSCVIQVGIQQKNLGRIMYAQNSFYEIFGYLQQDCNHIDQIIPYQIQSAHQQLFKQYLTSFNIHKSNIVDFNLILGQNSQGWAIPIKLKFLITLPSTASDVCITALIRKIKTKNYYLMCEIPSTKLIICDKRLYKILFSHLLKPSDVKEIYLNKLMPQYSQILKNIQTDKDKADRNQQEAVDNIQKTLLFIPKFSQNMQFQEMTKQLNDNDFEGYVNHLSDEIYFVYSVEFIIKKHRNQFISNDIIQFLSIDKMQTNQSTQLTVKQYKEFLISFVDKESTLRSPQKHSLLNINSQDLNAKKKKQQQMLPQFSTLASFSFPHDELETNKVLEQIDKDQVNSQRSLGFTQRYKQIVNSEQNLILEQLNNNYKIISKLNLDAKSRLNSSSIDNIELFSNPNLQETDLQRIDCSKKDSIQKFNSQILSSQRLLDNQINIYSPIFRAADSITPHSPKKNPYQLRLNVIHELDQSQVENINNNNINQVTIGQTNKNQSFQSDDEEDSFNDVEEKNQMQQISDRFLKQNNQNFESQQNKCKQYAKILEFKQEQKQQGQQLKHQIEYQSSQLSSDDSSDIKKQFFIEKIMKVKLNKSLILLQFIGIMGIITLLALQIVSFIQLKKQFQLETQHFINVSWPMEIRTCDSLQLYYLQFVKFQSNNIFSSPTDQNWVQFSQLNKERIVYYNEHFYDLNKQFIRYNKDDFPYFKNLTLFQIQYNFVKDYYTYDQIIPYSRSNSIYYFQYQWFYGFRRFSTNEIQSINDEAIINENFIFYFNPNTDLQLSIESTTLDVLNQIENSIQNLMIIAILLTFVIISAILPVYFNIQNTNQEILKLFSTFEPRTLAQMVFNLEKSIQSAFQMQKQMKNSNKVDRQRLQSQQKTQIIVDKLMSQMQVNPKNKVISSMNDIKKISIWLLFSCVFVFISLIIQPIVNNFIISSLIEQQVFNLKVMKTIYDLKAHFGSNLYLNMGNVLERMCQNCAFFDRDYFKTRVPVFFDLNQQKLQGLYEVVTNQSGYKKYNSDLYDKFLFKIMQGNLCEALRDYPQYLDKNFTLDFSKCSQLQQDILTKGFMISSKYLLEIFPPLFQLTQSNDLHLVQQEIKQWVQEINLIQFDEFITYMINTVTALTNFMIDMSNQYISFAESIELFLLIFQCIFLTIFMYFAWKILYKRLKDSLIVTRHALSLIDINYLYTNTYIVNYINKL
ncbi:hypothetical protein ABPG74_015350 [Tetrahymena malaccensis]